MSVFEPAVVLSFLKEQQPTAKRKEFETKWKKSVSPSALFTVYHSHRAPKLKVLDRVQTWEKSQKGQPINIAQFRWAAEVVQYVSHAYSMVKKHGNNKSTDLKLLPDNLPLLGPRFSPPSYLHSHLRKGLPQPDPQKAYLKTLHIIHPLYYPTLGLNCPRCDSTAVSWDSWTSTGPRDVHGLYRDETALGYQLRCKDCCDQNVRPYCLATTSREFWKGYKSWQVPRALI